MFVDVFSNISFFVYSNRWEYRTNIYLWVCFTTSCFFVLRFCGVFPTFQFFEPFRSGWVLRLSIEECECYRKKICVINWVPYINCLMSYLFGRFVLFLFTNPFALISRCQMMFTNQCFQFTRQTLSHKISNTGNRCWGQVTKVPLRCHSVKIKGNKNLHYFAFFAQLDVFLQRVTSCKYLQALASDPENSYKFPQQFEWVSQLLRAHWPLTQNICGKK